MEQSTSGTLKAVFLPGKDDGLEKVFRQCYNFVTEVQNSLNEKEAINKFHEGVRTKNKSKEIYQGFLAIILLEPINAQKTFKKLNLIVHDDFKIFVKLLKDYILERFSLLTDVAQSQMMWLLQIMVQNYIKHTDYVFQTLLREAAPGDVSTRNLDIIEKFLRIITGNIFWLENHPNLISVIIYKFLRLIEDHSVPHAHSLREKEIMFTVALIKAYFINCLAIGRDFIRLLQNVINILEFQKLWTEILTSPTTLYPSFNGILELLEKKTPRTYLQCTLTRKMEHDLLHLLSNVEYGNHTSYQDYIVKKYLNNPVSHSLCSDIIRFITCVVHPSQTTNTKSNLVPRWSVIGRLISICTTSRTIENAKRALFYDWLFYNPNVDDILYIEPAILLIHHSLSTNPKVSATLLDYLCKIMSNFHPPIAENIRSSVFSSLNKILQMNVLPSLQDLFESPKLDKVLQMKLANTFKDFSHPCSSINTASPEQYSAIDFVSLDNTNKSSASSNNIKNDDAQSDDNIYTSQEINELMSLGKNDVLDAAISLIQNEQTMGAISQINEQTNRNGDGNVNHTALHGSSKDEGIGLQNKENLEEIIQKIKQTNLNQGENCFTLDNLGEELQNAIIRLQNEQDMKEKCIIMKVIVQYIIDQNLKLDALKTLSYNLNILFINLYKTQKIFPDKVDYDSLNESITSPLFVIFKKLYNLTKKNDEKNGIIIKLITDMYLSLPEVGYLLLYFLKIRYDEKIKDKKNPEILKTLGNKIYKEFGQSMDKTINCCLRADLNRCRLDNREILMWLLPYIFTVFKEESVNNAEIIRIFVSSITSNDDYNIASYIDYDNLVMIKNENLMSVLAASLQWDSFEQMAFWKIIFYHKIEIDAILPIVPELNVKDHAEAQLNLIFLFKKQKPTIKFLRLLFSRKITKQGDSFLISIIYYWQVAYFTIFSDIVAIFLNLASKHRKTSKPSYDQILNHLDKLRQSYIEHEVTGAVNIFNSKPMQDALLAAKLLNSENETNKYSELFALAKPQKVIPPSTKDTVPKDEQSDSYTRKNKKQNVKQKKYFSKSRKKKNKKKKKK